MTVSGCDNLANPVSVTLNLSESIGLHHASFEMNQDYIHVSWSVDVSRVIVVITSCSVPFLLLEYVLDYFKEHPKIMDEIIEATV